MSVGLIEFAKLISPETFGCIKQPFFRNLLTLLNLQHLIDYQLVSFYSFFVMFGSIRFLVRRYHKQITVALQINGSAA